MSSHKTTTTLTWYDEDLDIELRGVSVSYTTHGNFSGSHDDSYDDETEYMETVFFLNDEHVEFSGLPENLVDVAEALEEALVTYDDKQGDYEFFRSVEEDYSRDNGSDW